MPQSIRETGSGAAFTVGGQLVPQPVRWRTFAGSLGLHLLAVLTALALDRSTAGEPYSPPTVAEAAAAEGASRSPGTGPKNCCPPWPPRRRSMGRRARRRKTASS